jgi:hypothetical protein
MTMWTSIIADTVLNNGMETQIIYFAKAASR